MADLKKCDWCNVIGEEEDFYEFSIFENRTDITYIVKDLCKKCETIVDKLDDRKGKP